MELKDIRENIDAVDSQLVELFVKRMELCGQVAEYKKENGLKVLDRGREEEKLGSVENAAGEKFGGYTRELYEKLMGLSRSYQKSMTGTFGLLGGKLGHSYSPQIHKLFGGYDYALFEKTPEELQKFFEEAPFDGINVTIPYKKAVIPLCDELSANAEKIGSVNTVIKLPNGKLLGDNTDYCGFEYLIKSAGIDVLGKKCLILGDGGVAPTIRAVLTDLGAETIITVSRKGENNFENISNHADAEIIVNATPVGMYPNNGSSLVDIKMFKNLSGVLDVVYNPSRTRLILDAENAGIPCAGGLRMLVYQAKRACELFLDIVIPDTRADEVTKTIENQRKNIVLIGMPGCGKTSAGRVLAELTGRELIDMDEELVNRFGCTIPEFFAANGEEKFRQEETKLLDEISRKSSFIISTGGGVVTRHENRDLLRQNSTVVFLDRTDLSTLSKNGRPVSQSTPIEELAEKRMPMYRSWNDITVECVNPEENARRILEGLGI